MSLSLAIAMTLAALGEPKTGSRLGGGTGYGGSVSSGQSAQESAVAARMMAGCAYMKQRGLVHRTLEATDPAEAEKLLMKSVAFNGTCMNLQIFNPNADAQRVSAPGYILRGILAETVIRQESLGQTLSPAVLKKDYDAAWFKATGRPREIDEMALCVSETNPDGVRALLATTAESLDEKAAIGRLAPNFGFCLAANAKLVGNRQSIRAALAEAFYHRAAMPSAKLANETK